LILLFPFPRAPKHLYGIKRHTPPFPLQYSPRHLNWNEAPSSFFSHPSPCPGSGTWQKRPSSPIRAKFEWNSCLFSPSFSPPLKCEPPMVGTGVMLVYKRIAALPFPHTVPPFGRLGFQKTEGWIPFSPPLSNPSPCLDKWADACTFRLIPFSRLAPMIRVGIVLLLPCKTGCGRRSRLFFFPILPFSLRLWPGRRA